MKTIKIVTGRNTIEEVDVRKIVADAVRAADEADAERAVEVSMWPTVNKRRSTPAHLDSFLARLKAERLTELVELIRKGWINSNFIG